MTTISLHVSEPMAAGGAGASAASETAVATATSAKALSCMEKMQKNLQKACKEHGVTLFPDSCSPSKSTRFSFTHGQARRPGFQGAILKSALEDKASFKETEEYVLLVVADGHGDNGKIAEHVTSEMLKILPECMKEDSKDPKAALQKAFARVNESLLAKFHEGTYDFGGAPAVVCYVDKKERQIYTATLGDCEALFFAPTRFSILGKRLEMIPLSCTRDWTAPKDFERLTAIYSKFLGKGPEEIAEMRLGAEALVNATNLYYPTLKTNAQIDEMFKEDLAAIAETLRSEEFADRSPEDKAAIFAQKRRELIVSKEPPIRPAISAGKALRAPCFDIFPSNIAIESGTGVNVSRTFGDFRPYKDPETGTTLWAADITSIKPKVTVFPLKSGILALTSDGIPDCVGLPFLQFMLKEAYYAGKFDPKATCPEILKTAHRILDKEAASDKTRSISADDMTIVLLHIEDADEK